MGSVVSGFLGGDDDGGNVLDSLLDPTGQLPTVSEWGDSLTGAGAAEAALAGAQLQAQSAREALDYTKEKDALQRADLMPFADWGKSAVPFYTMLLNPQVQAGYLQSNPMFRAAIDQGNRRLSNTLGFAGKRGDLENAITQNYMAQGNQFIDSAFNRLLQPIQIGQASAAGQAANTGANTNTVSSLLTGIGNAQAAGGIGAANALSQGAGNIAQIGGSILGALFACDEALKRDIEPIGIDPEDGIMVCIFRYIGHAAWYLGKMAQDIALFDPSSVIECNGALFVTEQYAPVRIH